MEILKKSIDEMERNEKKAALGADKDLAQFEVLFDQTQSNVYKMQGILLKVGAGMKRPPGSCARPSKRWPRP